MTTVKNNQLSRAKSKTDERVRKGRNISVVPMKGAAEQVLVQKRVSHKGVDARTSQQREWGRWGGKTEPPKLLSFNSPNTQGLKDSNSYLNSISPVASKRTDLACSARTPPKLRQETTCHARGPATKNTHTISARREMARNQVVSKHHRSYTNNSNRVVLNAFAQHRERANTRQVGTTPYVIVRLIKDSWVETFTVSKWSLRKKGLGQQAAQTEHLDQCLLYRVRRTSPDAGDGIQTDP